MFKITVFLLTSLFPVFIFANSEFEDPAPSEAVYQLEDSSYFVMAYESWASPHDAFRAFIGQPGKFVELENPIVMDGRGETILNFNEGFHVIFKSGSNNDHSAEIANQPATKIEILDFKVPTYSLGCTKLIEG